MRCEANATSRCTLLAVGAATLCTRCAGTSHSRPLTDKLAVKPTVTRDGGKKYLATAAAAAAPPAAPASRSTSPTVRSNQGVNPLAVQLSLVAGSGCSYYAGGSHPGPQDHAVAIRSEVTQDR